MTFENSLYEIRFKEDVIGRSWGLKCASPGGGTSLRCWLAFDDYKPLAIRRYRRISETCFDERGNPALLRGRDSNGNTYRIGKNRLEGVEAVLEANAVPQLAEAFHRLVFRCEEGFRSVRTYLLESDQTVTLDFTKSGSAWETSFGEVFWPGEDGVMERLDTLSPDMRFVRVPWLAPRWRIGKVAPRNSRPYVFRPGIQVKEGKLKNAKETPFTFVAPHSGSRCNALFIGGSGIYDRHGRGADMDIGYGQLLDDLAIEGIASIRYDRYGSFEGDRANHLDTDLPQMVEDAVFAYSALKEVSSPSARFILIGHSLGGLIGLAAATLMPSLDAIVLIAVPGRPMTELISSQMEWLFKNADYSLEGQGKLRDEQARFVGTITDLQSKDKLPPRYAALERRREYLRQLYAINPPELVAQSQHPLVIVTCGRDIQVLPEDGALLMKAAENAGRSVKYIQLEGLNHILRPAIFDKDDIWHYNVGQIPSWATEAIAQSIFDTIDPGKLKKWSPTH